VIRNNFKHYFLILSFVGLYITNSITTVAQKVDSISGSRKIIFWSGYGLGYTMGMTWLYQSWYKHYAHSSFHWFDDSKEWLQMDKAGHAFSTFHLAKLTYNGLKQIGYTHQKAALLAGLSSFITISSIELFDAYSEKWGASYTDLSSNLVGAMFFYLQTSDKNLPIDFKFSFHKSPYAAIRPDALGKHLHEQILKDYNGQTYWLSLNPYECGIKKSPPWLNIAWGYSAENMTSGTNDKSYRQYFFSLDFNSKSIKTKNKFFKILLKSFNVIKFPFPTVEFSKNKLHGYWLYF